MSASLLDTHLTHDVTTGSSDNITSAPTSNEMLASDSVGQAGASTFILCLVIVLFPLTFLLGSIGNLLVIVVVYMNKHMRNSTNLLIISLAIADLCFIVCCVPFTGVILTLNEWPMGDVFCRVYNYVINVTCYAGVYTLVLMSLDRFLAVRFCSSAYKGVDLRTTKNALIVIALMWFIILMANIPILVDTGVINLDGQEVCLNTKIVREILEYENYTPARVFYGCFFFFGYFLPFVLICVLYGLILCYLSNRPRLGGQQSDSIKKRNQHVTRMVTIVVGVFALCWLPQHVRFLMQFFFRFYSESTAFQTFQTLATCVSYMNSCMNPILYAFLSEHFRKGFRNVICSCCPRVIAQRVRGGAGRNNIELDATCAATGAVTRAQTKHLLSVQDTNGKTTNHLQVTTSALPTSTTSINTCTSLWLVNKWPLNDLETTTMPRGELRSCIIWNEGS